jgi:RHS repeat-associated protein
MIKRIIIFQLVALVASISNIVIARPAVPPVGISGVSAVTVGQITTYNYILEQAVCPLWTVDASKGVIVSQDASSVTISWISPGSAVLRIWNDCAGTILASKTITVTGTSCVPITPVATFAYSSNACGDKTITWTGTKPSGVMWYWQTSPSGTSTASSTTSLVVSSSGTYYLRAQATCLAWSVNSIATQSITVNPIPNKIVSSTSASVCGGGSATLAAVPGANANSIRWYASQSGGPILAEGLNYPTTILTTTTSYYVSSYNSVSGCESVISSIPVTATVNQLPSFPILSNIESCSGISILTASPGANGVSTNWYANSTGGSALPTQTNTYTTPNLTATTTYYVTSVASNGCESSPRQPLKVTIDNDLCANWSEKIVYDKTGNAVADSRNYKDGTGKSIQSQWVDFANGKIWASQPLFDYLNVPVAVTLPAPLIQTTFGYKSDFVQNSVNQNYSPSDFDNLITGSNSLGEISNPKPVGSAPGTLGWYYSSGNNLEPATPTTQFPYSRTYTPSGPNPLITRSSSVGENNRMGGGHEKLITKGKISNGELNHYDQFRKIYGLYTLAPNLAGFVTTASTSQFIPVTATVKTGPYGIDVTSTGGSQSGISEIGGLIPVTPGKTYVYTITGYKSAQPPGNTVYADQLSLSVTASSGALIVWPGSNLSVGDGLNKKSCSSTFTVPAGVTTIRLGIKFFVSTPAGAKFTISNVEIREDIPLTSSGYKVVGTDQNGKQSVVYQDSDGRKLATLVDGKWSYNYYNDIGQLVVNVPPNGINTSLNTLNFLTYFKYDQLGRLIERISPDDGKSQYVYSQDGKIRFSQNQLQRDATPPRFAYTNYDYLGRLIESGEYEVSGSSPYIFEPHTTISPTANSILSIADNVGYSGVTGFSGDSRCKETSFIDYDNPSSDYVTDALHAVQENLIGRVSRTKTDNVVTWFSYDEFGQVIWTKQNIVGLGTKVIDYTYSYFGNVLKVAYQQGLPDAFFHHYEYDNANRLSIAYTSIDGITKNVCAKYYYYAHGPLKRVELGGNVQGIDYVYNINGSLKFINHPDPAKDLGQDGFSGANVNFKQDVFGLALDYNSTDYTPAGYSNAGTFSLPSHQDQYGGTLKAVRWHSQVDNHIPRGYAYSYDNQYQLTNAEFGNVSGSGNYSLSINNVSGTPNYQQYKESIGSYDANGNIQSLVRNGKTGNSLANYTYNYSIGTNQLASINNGGSTLVNYQYNSIGQMIQQTEGGNTMKISYTLNGLVKEVRDGNNVLKASYIYDSRGNRIKKTVYTSAGLIQQITYYVNDARGNSLATYEQDVEGGGALYLTEVPVYASGRIGIYKPLVSTVFYEVADHLGNVRGVIGSPAPLTYVATMEDNGQQSYSNPRVQELAYFKNLAATEDSKPYMNHTVASIAVPTPNKTSYTYWKSGYAGITPEIKSIGASIGVVVQPGDKIDLETYVKFEKKAAYSRSNIVTVMSTLLANSFLNSAPGLETVTKATQVFNSGVVPVTGTTLIGNGTDTQELPFAYLYYVLYDRQFNWITSGFKRVVSGAGFDAGSEITSNHAKISLPQITITEPGYIYVFVANESEDTKVWWDDLTVKHQRNNVVAGADYYPFGLVMENREITRESYRYGYQGQFSEKDKETGWNAFQLRMYEPRFGRWFTQDPKRQFFSPYIGMGNSPGDGVDPDGGFKLRIEARLYQLLFGGTIEKAIAGPHKGEYFVGKQVKLRNGAGVQYNRAFDFGIEVKAKITLDFSAGVQFGSHVTGLAGLDLSLLTLSLRRWDIDLGYSSSGNGFGGMYSMTDFDGIVKQYAKLDAPYIGIEYNNSQDWYGKNYEHHVKVHAGAPGLGLELQDTYLPGVTAPIGKVVVAGSVGGHAVLGLDLGYEISFGKN